RSQAPPVPSTTDSMVVTVATIRLFSSVRTSTESVQSAVYQSRVKPVHTMLSFDWLNENTTRMAIGREKKAKTRPAQVASKRRTSVMPAAYRRASARCNGRLVYRLRTRLASSVAEGCRWSRAGAWRERGRKAGGGHRGRARQQALRRRRRDRRCQLPREPG